MSKLDYVLISIFVKHNKIKTLQNIKVRYEYKLNSKILLRNIIIPYIQFNWKQCLIIDCFFTNKIICCNFPFYIFSLIFN